MKKKIILSAYAISPVKGSEYGAAWNMVVKLSQQHELWVLYGISDDHMGDTQTLREHIKNNPLPSVTFIEVRPGQLSMAINKLNKWGLGWFFYFAYYLWQKNALKEAEKIINEVDIDVVHQFGPIGYREPGFLGRLNKPLVWGPIGGMNIISKTLLENKSFKAKLKFNAKNAINHFQLGHSARIKKAFQRADVLIAATGRGQQTIKEKFGRESYYLPEQGVINSISLNESKFNTINDTVHLIWSGTHIERKNLDLCLDALSLVSQKNWMLHILGDGPLTEQMRQRADELQLSANITWHGMLKRDEALKVMDTAHLHIITSIAEDNPAVVFEALSAGVPTLTPAHCGMDDVICNTCGIKIKPGNRTFMSRSIATAIENILKEPAILKNKADATVSCAGKHTWDIRLNKINAIYNEAIVLHGKATGYVIDHLPLNILQDA